MWTRAELKEKAKDVLRNCYWKSFLVSILIAIGMAGNGSSSNSGVSNDAGHPITKEVLLIIIILVIGVLLFRLFLGFMLEVGGRRFYIQAAKADYNLSHLGFPFRKERYFNILKSMFITGLYIILWTLLLIIPGIIKSYAYRFVPYILAENPNMETSRAIQLSNVMTDGHKFDMFVLDLSFIGWVILALIPFGLGIPFLLPYIDATYAQLYLVLKNNIITQGFTSEEELNMQFVESRM